MKVSVFLNRALSGVGKSTKYESPGKMPAFSANSWPLGAANDCSGFVDWCLRFSPDRRVDHPLYEKINGGWFETTTIHADGLSDVGYFSRVDVVVPGCLLVYPDYKGSDGKWHDGHVGVVINSNGPEISDVTEVVHCSLGSWKNHGDAIRETGPQIWEARADSIAVWFDGLEKD